MLVILDRDGVINEDRADFVKSPEELVLIEGTVDAIARLKSRNHRVVIATNQSCIGRGIINEERLHSIHAKMLDAIARAGGSIDQIYYAPDAPWAETPMRKPGSGMLTKAMEDFKTTPSNTIMIGDSLRDLQAAYGCGVHRLLVQTGKGRKTQADGTLKDLLPVSVAANLSKAVDLIEDGRFI
ncbi:D-glycero-alpha-D-manno-heptose-1,7-bisphosphate 7-phosphatase [Sneathiella glossodoripedis]|uniref:D-glycero-alpha-D-manno-heptose-1,7-bisphosphate 7-phosphatase n=1 Tax=Sneathiella glossodoripedis TaxID=418853 RepID=UPI000471534D|nr:HAD-IIIA family hydrolase [Sneathiella glossodoripedis]